ncbi:flocculation protein FLO11 [Zea mays]|nr:flocculation protein FLO11 [Zea mays]
MAGPARQEIYRARLYNGAAVYRATPVLSLSPAHVPFIARLQRSQVQCSIARCLPAPATGCASPPAMASAVASSVHAGPAAAGALTFGWLGPRLSLGGRDASATAAEAEEPAAASNAAEPAISKDFIDFEFCLGVSSTTMLPADELFADGKLLPLRPPQAAAARGVERRRDTALVEEVPAAPELSRAARLSAPEAALDLDPYVFSPKAPTCSSRWRELLRLRKAGQTPSASASPPASPAATPSSRASSSSAARSLKLLLQRSGGGRVADLAAAPLLLRDSSDSEASLSLTSSRYSLSSSSSSSGHDHDDFPRHSLDSVDPTPRPRIRLVRSHPQAPQPQPHPPVSASASAPAPAPARAAHSPARRRPSPSPSPPPPQQQQQQASVISVDSPRMNASGKIVFQGLERSSSSPAGSAHSSMRSRSRSRSRVMDRSYSAGVRATPVVLNVPVCSRPVFGFFKDKKEAAAAAARSRSALGRRTTTTTTAAAGGVGGRDLGNGKLTSFVLAD